MDWTFYVTNLKKLTKKLLCLPHSTAAVERLFSSIDVMKTKLRNKLSTTKIKVTLGNTGRLSAVSAIELTTKLPRSKVKLIRSLIKNRIKCLIHYINNTSSKVFNNMFSQDINNDIQRFQFYLGLLLTLFTLEVTPGANDLHFYDGSSTTDIIAGDVFFEILDPPELRYTYRIRPAKDFGAPFNGSITFERARLVPTVPLHSCSDIINQDEIIGNIALSERGECSFVHKTFKAQRAGARAVIITESIDRWDEALDHLIEMVDDKTEVEVHIPAAFLLGRSGATVLGTLRRLHRRHAVVTLPVNVTHTPLRRLNQPPWIAW